MNIYNRRSHKKRRIRKKWRLAEFTDYGFRIKGKLKGDTDTFIDNMIVFVEAHGMALGCGFHDEHKTFEGCVTSEYVPMKKWRSLTEADRQFFTNFISHPAEGAYDIEIGPLVDAWRDL